MDLLPLIPDNITEVLTKIIRFTELRETVLQRNIKQAATSGYVPRDLPVAEFADILDEAVREHLNCGCLVFRDTTCVAFYKDGRMTVQPVTDESAGELLHTDPDQYLQLQGDKLRENALNRRVSQQLLKHSCTATTRLRQTQRRTTGAHRGAPEMSLRTDMND